VGIAVLSKFTSGIGRRPRCLKVKKNECIELFPQNLHFIAHRILYMIIYVEAGATGIQ